MTNPYYTASGTPATGSAGASSPMRTEYSLIQAAFAFLPDFTAGAAGAALVVNSTKTAITLTTGALALAGNLVTTGAFNTTFVQQASISITLPLTADTLVGRTTTDTLTNKTISGASNTLTSISNSSLTNSSVTVGSTAISLGGAAATVAGLTLTTPNIGTPSAGVLTNCTGLPITTGVSGLGANVATFLATPSSANLAAAVTGETGTGALVFDTSPNFTGPVGIGMVPVNVLDITKTQNSVSNISILNASGGAAGEARYLASNGTAALSIGIYGTGFTTSGISRQNGARVDTGGAGGLTISTSAAQPIYFGISGAEVAQFSSTGDLLIANTAQQVDEKFQVRQTAAAKHTAYFSNSNVTPGAALIGRFTYTNAAPNDTTSIFLYCSDNTLPRFFVNSNGGISNYSANNVNLSDASMKTSFELLTNDSLNKFESAFINVDWGRYKYKDQTHDDWNYGYTAQGVKAAFKDSCPSITGVWNPTKDASEQLEGVYTHDLDNIAHALLSRALKRITVLEESLGIKVGIK